MSDVKNLKNRKILITCTDVMMFQFIVPHIQYLDKLGCKVDIACSSADGYQNEGYLGKIQNNLPDVSKCFFIRTERNPFSFHNMAGYKDLKAVIYAANYDLIWTNEPVMGVLTRLAAKRYRHNGGKIMYLVHGYHFFKGAPRKNWLYYPIEKIMSGYCDAITVINWEDYYFTKKYFKTPVFHIDGIGLDLEKYKNVRVDYKKKRKELGIKENDILIISVGELQSRKNHEVIIRAIAKLNNPNIKYIICGRGELLDDLKKLSSHLNLNSQIQFLGHRYDIAEILNVADIFAHPSQREGLGIAAIEAMSAGLPLVTSNIQGIKDYVKNDENGYANTPYDIDGFAEAISKLILNPELRHKMGCNNQLCAEKYSIEKSVTSVAKILDNILESDNR